MSEPGKEPQIETVPKSELEKVQNDAKQQIEVLQRQIEEAKTNLLSPEYLDYLETKKKGAKPAPDGKEPNEEVKALKVQLRELQANQAEIAAAQELDAVIKAHDDFEAYRADVKKILESAKNDLTIEQAYFIAKATKTETPEEKAAREKAAKEKKPEFSTEKPSGTYPVTKDAEKKFKSEIEAGLDAAAQVAAKYNIQGGVI